MNFLKILEDFAQNYPVLYACTVIVTALTVSAVANLIVKKILLRGLKQIFCRLGDRDEAGQSLVLQIASRLANILPVIVLYCIPAMFPEVDFVFRPHPLLFPRLSSPSKWGESKAAGYLEAMSAFPNVEIETGGDYFATFASSDALWKRRTNGSASLVRTDENADR